MVQVARQALADDLCLLADVKDYVFRGGGNQTNLDDNLIQRLISAASQWMREETSREFAAMGYNEIRSGAGGRQTVMFVKNPPIQSVTSVYVDGNNIAPKPAGQTNYTQPGFSFTDDHVTLWGAIFTDGVDNVEIDYTGGYNSVPYDLEQACIEAVAWAYREIDRLGQKSKILAGETVTFDMSAMSDRAQRTLQRYQRVTPGVGT